MPKVTKKMDAEMTIFSANVLESIKQAKRIELAQNSFIEHLMAIPKTPAKAIDEFDPKRLDVQLRTIDLDDSSNSCLNG
jgi:hypothetical protein